MKCDKCGIGVYSVIFKDDKLVAVNKEQKYDLKLGNLCDRCYKQIFYEQEFEEEIQRLKNQIACKDVCIELLERRLKQYEKRKRNKTV